MSITSLFRRGARAGSVPSNQSASTKQTTKPTPTIPTGPAGRTIEVIDPEHLVDHHAELLDTLRSAATLTKDEFAELVMPTVRNLAGHLQLLPSSEQEHHSDLAGGFRHCIEVAIAAVRLSYSRDLTARAKESRSTLEQCMRVTLIMAALLHDAGKPVTDMEIVALCNGERVTWCPYLESLTAWATRHRLTEFEVEWVPGRHKRHEAFTGMFGLRLIDRSVLCFIEERGAGLAMQHLWEGAIGNLDGHSVVKDLVKEADRETSLADLRASRSTRRGAEEGHRADRILALIQENLASGKWRFNEQGGWIWLLDRGLFLTWPVAWMHLLNELRERDEKGYPSDPDAIVAWLIGRGLSTPFFCPGEGNRNLWFFAPSMLRTRVGSATVLSGVRISDVELIFGKQVPSSVDEDQYPEVVAGRIEYQGAQLPAGLISGQRKTSGSPKQSTAQEKTAAGEPGKAKATKSKPAASKKISETVQPSLPIDADEDIHEPIEAEDDPKVQSSAAETATAWLMSETTKGRLIVREMMYRLVSPKDKALQWGKNAAVWRDRLAMAWPDAVNGLGMDAKDALQGLIEHGVLFQEAMRGSDGFVHRINLCGQQRDVVAFKEPITQILMPLVEKFKAKPQPGPKPEPSEPNPFDDTHAQADPAPAADQPVEHVEDLPEPPEVVEQADSTEDAPPQSTPPSSAPTGQGEVSLSADAVDAIPEVTEDMMIARSFLKWLMHTHSPTDDLDVQALTKAFSAQSEHKVRLVRRALTSGANPVISKGEGSLSRLNQDHPDVLALTSGAHA